MARIKYSGLISNISGSIGGSTFQVNKYGTSIRNKPVLCKSDKPSQQLMRSHVSTALSIWHSIPESYRMEWNAIASYVNQNTKHNKNVLLSGYPLFMKYNIMLLMNEASPVTSPIYSLNSLLYSDLLIMLNSPTSLYFNLTIYSPATAVWFVLKLSHPMPATVSPVKSLCKHILITPEAGPFWEVGPQYEAIFGKLPEVGQTLFYELTTHSLLTPQISNPVLGKTIVVSP